MFISDPVILANINEILKQRGTSSQVQELLKTKYRMRITLAQTKMLMKQVVLRNKRIVLEYD